MTGMGNNFFSFVNNINTVEGGTHVSGFRSALTKACNKRAQALGMLKGGEGETLSSEDVREGLTCVISIKVPEPQFEGQTKTKLGNSEVKGLVDSWTFAQLNTFFEENPQISRKILQKAEIAKRAREAAKKARDLTRRKTVFESTVLPGKLADCTNEDPSKSELFIVEGDSAGGSAKQARDRFNQAILPLRGKILNVEKARLDKILSNEEIKALIAAVGCGVGDEFDGSKARYHKIILMTDADVDGSHIRTLLLTFFFRYMCTLIENGYLYIAKPPLYKAKIGRKEQYLLDDRAFKSFLFDWAYDHTSMSTNRGPLSQEEWQALLGHVRSYDEQLEHLAHDFKLGYDACHQLATTFYQKQWNREDGIEALLTHLRTTLPEYGEIVAIYEENGSEEQEGPVGDPIITLRKTNSQIEAPLPFFSSPQLRKLLDRLQPIASLHHEQWTLQVTNKDRSISKSGIPALVYSIRDIAKPYMNIQRYKGLGEMNPEQLWETAMDESRRTLLQVTIEDALEADRWFVTLMGDDVAGRRDYIKRFGQFARHLDV